MYWLPWHHHYLCRVADTRTAIHKTHVNYMYTIPTYCVCVCVCVCARALYVCVCVCVCVIQIS